MAVHSLLSNTSTGWILREHVQPFGLIVKLILISNDIINKIFEGAWRPIICVDTPKNHKIQVLLIIFCEGESDDEFSLTSTVATILNRNVDAMTDVNHYLCTVQYLLWARPAKARW